MISSCYDTCYSFINDELLPMYFSGSLCLNNEFSEDALMGIVGMIGKVQKDLKVPSEKRLDISYVLDFIFQNKLQSPLFKRRFTHIII